MPRTTLDHPPEAKTFISCSRKDMAFADRPEAVLKVRGFEVLIDRTDIYDFEDWWERIEALIGVAPAHATAARAVRKRPEIFVECRAAKAHMSPSRAEHRTDSNILKTTMCRGILKSTRLPSTEQP